MIKVAQLLQVIQEAPRKKREEMRKFILLVAAQDKHALEIIRRVESGELHPTDALNAMDACIEAQY
jgi:hypothetical protein